MGIIADAILVVLQVMYYAIIISVLLTWIPGARESKFAGYLKMITDPVLGPVRELTNKLMGGRNFMFDFSPIFAVILLHIIMEIVERLR